MINSYQERFPQREQLWRGAILATIGHAIWIMPDPTLSYELSWDGFNYSRQDSQGTRGTITFAQDGIVGVFRDDHSSRAPWNTQSPYNIAVFLNNMPEELLTIAQKEALQYVIDEHNGKVEPLITAAFWGIGEDITATESWFEVFTHGAHLVTIELLEPEQAIQELTQQYEWEPMDVELLRALFARRMENPMGTAQIIQEEWDMITRKGVKGIEDSRTLLEAIGITPP